MNADYWRTKYEALATGLRDPAALAWAEQAARIVETLHTTTTMPYDEARAAILSLAMASPVGGMTTTSAIDAAAATNALIQAAAQPPARDQASEIYTYIRDHRGCTIREIVDGTGWHELVVTTALRIMTNEGLVEMAGTGGPWNDPLWRVTTAPPPTGAG